MIRNNNIQNENIIFIDVTSNYTYNDIINIAIGASEHQFYNLIYNLSKIHCITCFNSILYDIQIDNIYYSNIENIYKSHDKFNDCPIIIQRVFPFNDKFKNIIHNSQNIKQNNKIYLWIHDLASPMIFLNNDNNLIHYYISNNDKNKYKNEVLNYYFENKNINFVFNSEFCKDEFNNYMQKYDIYIEEYRISVIYNILYEDEFRAIKNTTYPKNINNIVYASAWQKGIEKIIEIFNYIIKIDNSITLTLLSPGYDLDKYIDYQTHLINIYPNNIIILGKLNKSDYARVIKSSLCVLSSTFKETFGCVFSESYYLGTPVIADFRSGAVKEIIDKNYIVNYDNPYEIYIKIKELQENNIDNMKNNIIVNEKFLLHNNLNKWLKICKK
jgi:hypothetical protein